MTKRDNSPAILDEIKAELDPIIEEGIKWLEDNDKAETDVYKEKQKEFEAKVNPLMQKLYSQGGVPGMSGMPGMPDMSGMSGMSGMPGAPSDLQEEDEDEDEDSPENVTGKPSIDELD